MIINKKYITPKSRPAAFLAYLVMSLYLASFANADSSLPHNAGNIEMLVSDWGALTEVQGENIYPNFMYIVEDEYRYYMDPFSDIWAGDSSGWVASGFDGFEDGLYFGEWQPTMPAGYAEYIPDHPNASQCIHAQYAPDRYGDFEEFPHSITVDQYTYAWDPDVYPDDGDYIMMKLILTNTGSFELEDFYLAVQTNWDVDDLDRQDDLVDWDDERRAGIAYDSDATDPMYLALTLIDGRLASHNIVDADEWDFSDLTKSDLMSNGEVDDLSTIGSAPANYLNIISAGPYDIPAGGSVSVVYAFAIGRGLDELRDNIDAAGKRAIVPGKLSAEASSEVIHLTWAESINPGVDSYKVYRSDTGGSGYSEIAQVSGNDTEYSDTKVQMGVMYYYIVTAIGPDGRESGYSNEVNAIPGVAPPPPRSLGTDSNTILRAPAEITLHWELSDDDNITGYKVFRNFTGSEPWTAIATVDSDVRAFVDREIYDGDTYYYTIAAVNVYNWISEYSNVISVTVDLPGPLDPAVNLSAVKVAPNPCGISGRLRFINLPARAEIHVYTSAGKLVKTLHHIDGTGEEEWDLRNEQGAVLASGIYVYYIESYKAEETGKFTTSGKFALIK